VVHDLTSSRFFQTTKSITVGDDFIGSVKIGSWSWLLLNEFIVLNAINEPTYMVYLKSSYPTSLFATWEVQEKVGGKIVATFGYNFPTKHRSEQLGLTFQDDQDLKVWDKALIFGAAVIIVSN